MAPVNGESCCKLCDGWLLSDGPPDVWRTAGVGDGGHLRFSRLSRQTGLPQPVLPTRRALPRCPVP